MACESPPRECLAWHIAPKLNGALTADGRTVRAACPAHGGRKRSLDISAGDHARLTWHCHRGCDPADVREALIGAGIDPGCLPRVRKRTDREWADAISAALQLGDTELRIELARLLHPGASPAELRAVARIGRTSLWMITRERRAGGSNPTTPVDTADDTERANPQVSHDSERSRGEHHDTQRSRGERCESPGNDTQRSVPHRSESLFAPRRCAECGRELTGRSIRARFCPGWRCRQSYNRRNGKDKT